MSARIGLAVLLFLGATFSLACEAYCAHALADAAQPLAQAAPPCHGQGAPAPEPSAPSGDAPEASTCCPDLAYAATTPGEPPVDPASAALATSSTCADDLRPVASGRRILRPPDRVASPYSRQNPPQLA